MFSGRCRLLPQHRAESPGSEPARVFSSSLKPGGPPLGFSPLQPHSDHVQHGEELNLGPSGLDEHLRGRLQPAQRQARCFTVRWRDVRASARFEGARTSCACRHQLEPMMALLRTTHAERRSAENAEKFAEVRRKLRRCGESGSQPTGCYPRRCPSPRSKRRGSSTASSSSHGRISLSRL